jgi:hypothetical protein
LVTLAAIELSALTGGIAKCGECRSSNGEEAIFTGGGGEFSFSCT